jgi:hypothetical protein
MQQQQQFISLFFFFSTNYLLTLFVSGVIRESSGTCCRGSTRQGCQIEDLESHKAGYISVRRR